MRNLLIFFGLLSLAAAQPAGTRQFMIRLDPVRQDFSMQNITEAERPTVMQHAAYMKALTDQGKLVIAGHVAEAGGMWGMIIVNAPDAESATAIIDADPLVKNK
jgi:uncharacterized protein YciI